METKGEKECEMKSKPGLEDERAKEGKGGGGGGQKRVSTRLVGGLGQGETFVAAIGSATVLKVEPEGEGGEICARNARKMRLIKRFRRFHRVNEPSIPSTLAGTADKPGKIVEITAGRGGNCATIRPISPAPSPLFASTD